MPTYRALLNRIAEQHELTVYSEVPVERQWLELEHRYRIKGGRIAKPRYLRDFLFLCMVIRDHMRVPFHLVHAHSTYPTGFVAVILQKVFHLPAVVSLHAAEASAFPDIQFGDLLHRRRTRINRWVIKHAKTVTTLTNFQRDEVVKNLQIRRPVVVMHRGVDVNRFYFERARDLKEPITFLSVGYLNAIKDPETLLRAFYKIHMEVDSVLIIVGRDYTAGAVMRLAVELGISHKIEYAGYVNHDNMNGFYRRADVLLHTARYESQGMVIAEAMAAGVLVVGTKVGLLSDLSGECCLTAPTRDPDALARVALDLLSRPEAMTRLRRNAYAWTQHHSLDVCCQEILRLYQRSITGQ